MFRLPPPPRFTLPPPPMLSSDIFDTKLLFRLSCSSIQQRQRQQKQQLINSRSIMFSCIILTIILLLILVFIMIKFHRRRKPRFTSDHHNSKLSSVPISITASNTLSMNTSQSYESITSGHTGFYVESINTSATTYSTNPSNIIYLPYSEERHYSTISPLPPYYHTLDILPY
ncbi:hypothetical protein I4U23_009460 [Adineta vaga]|nr:hypothetical protein I4U23_009460 [Adineta vaga]